jgi:hypothetical protein
LARVTAIVIPASASTATGCLRAGLIHVKLPSANLLAVQPFNGFFRFAVVRHFNESETA